MTQVRYLTTSIPYVNAAPHVGFALEAVLADVHARHLRGKGHDVRFQSGTDELSLKNVLAAEAAGVPTEDLVAANAARFEALQDALGLSYDTFFRTSADPRHRPGVQKLWSRLHEAGDLYKRPYEGLYCTGCEGFYEPSELCEGLCPEHGTAPETVREENWFFRLSRYGDRILEALRSGEVKVSPASKAREAIAFVEQGLKDISVSRSAERARGWGVPVPGDDGQVVYVWIDALGNYVTGLGYGGDEADVDRWWSGADTREHVIGKGILRFHTVYWLGILLSAGLPLPTHVHVHGYLTVDGRKIGKSAGNAVDPVPVAQEVGVDALRHYLLRHVGPERDGDFSVERLQTIRRTELAGQLGNLAQRVLTIAERSCGGTVVGDVDPKDPFVRRCDLLQPLVDVHLDAFRADEALDAIFEVVAEANREVVRLAPWTHAKVLSQGGPEADEAGHRLHADLATLIHVIEKVAVALRPLLPDTSARLLSKLGDAAGGRRTGVAAGEPLFPVR